MGVVSLNHSMVFYFSARTNITIQEPYNTFSSENVNQFDNILIILKEPIWLKEKLIYRVMRFSYDKKKN